MKIAAFGTMWNEEVMAYYYHGLNQWAKDTGGIVDLYICHGRTNMDNLYNVGEYAIYDYADLSEYDGVVMIASNINEASVREHLVERIRQANIPCVVVDYEIEGFSRIYIDQEIYINKIVHHLADDHGAKKMCYIGGMASNVEGNARYQGFCTGMTECGLDIRPDWVFEMRFRFNDGYDVARKLLENREDFPEAIVCANDDMAAGVCEALLEEGLEIGKDCLVTGLDQYLLGENFSPSLTTVRRPRESIAYHACEMIADKSHVKDYKERANIIFGQTCGCGNNYCKNQTEFRRYVFNTFNNRDMFSAMIAHMEESMISGDSIESMTQSMLKVFARFKEGRCRILLQPDVEKRPESAYDSYRTCTKDYMLWQGDATKTEIEGHAYVYAPIHFLNHLYGVCIFRDIPQFMNNKELYNFTKSIGFSLENMVQKKKYSLVNDKLQDLYETDYLTGTYNRHGYAKYAHTMLHTARSEGKDLQVIFVDVDGLKTINDQYGHEAGDIVIRIVGQSANEIADEKTKVFRYGGDEFLILHNDDDDFEYFYSLIEKTIKEKSAAMNLPYKVSASVGYVLARPQDSKTLEEYVKEADDIMYEIKRKHHGEM